MKAPTVSTILDFQFRPLSAETYSLAICERHLAQPLSSQQIVSATFSHRVDFLTDFGVDQLNASTKDPAERFDKLRYIGHGISPHDGGGLLLEDAHGNKLAASIAEVMQAVTSGVDRLRLAVISGCQTARTLDTGAFSDLARELLLQTHLAYLNSFDKYRELALAFHSEPLRVFFNGTQTNSTNPMTPS